MAIGKAIVAQPAAAGPKLQMLMLRPLGDFAGKLVLEADRSFQIHGTGQRLRLRRQGLEQLLVDGQLVAR